MIAKINLNPNQKMILRGVLIFVCMIGVVYEIYNLNNYRKVISDDDFSLCNHNQDINNSIDYDFFDSQLGLEQKNKYKEENEISKSIVSMISLIFYLFVVSLLYPKNDNE